MQWFRLNNVTNLHQFISHSTTTCSTTWRSYRDHLLQYRHFTVCIDYVACNSQWSVRCIDTCSTRRWPASDSEWSPTSSHTVASLTPLSETKSTSSCVISRSRDRVRLLLVTVRPYKGLGSWWRTACLVWNRLTHSTTTCLSQLLCWMQTNSKKYWISHIFDYSIKI